MSARAALRAATAADHDRVDTIFSRYDLSSGSDYGAFLCAQASALLPIEEALDEAGAEQVVPDWPVRRRANLLKADLDALHIPLPEPLPARPIIIGKASILGAVYVLEGSRLGGAVLKRGLAEGAPKRFLDARQDAGSWRKLLKSLDDLLVRPDQLEAAAVAAREIFSRFETGGERWLERRVE